MLFHCDTFSLRLMDSGLYSCQPSVGDLKSVTVHVIRSEPCFILDLPDFCWHFPWGWKFWQFWKFGHFNIYWKVQIFCADATSPLWTCHGHITFYFFQLEVWSKKKRTFCIDPSWWKPKQTKLERESPKLRLRLFNLNLNRYDLRHSKMFFLREGKYISPAAAPPTPTAAWSNTQGCGLSPTSLNLDETRVWVAEAESQSFPNNQLWLSGADPEKWLPSPSATISPLKPLLVLLFILHPTLLTKFYLPPIVRATT